MATKYTDDSLSTGLNDGTSVANAWQSLEEVLKNTMASGSYAAGDTIQIRTHDGTSDIVVDLSNGAIVQAIVGTETAPVMWVADAGVVWAGDSGTLTVRKLDDNTRLSFSSYNIFIGTDYNFVFKGDTTSHARCFSLAASGMQITFKDVYFWTVGATALRECLSITASNGSRIDLIRCKFLASTNYSGFYPVNIFIASSAEVNFIDCTFDFTGIGTSTAAFLKSHGYGLVVNIVGGKCVNTSVINDFILMTQTVTSTGSQQRVLVNGLDRGLLPLLDSNYSYTNTIYKGTLNPLLIHRSFGGNSSFLKASNNGQILWDEEGNFPTLNAVLPDSGSTAWSIRVRPAETVSKLRPFTLFDINKFWNQTAAVGTITVEMLIKDTSGGSGVFDNPLKEDWYILVSYVDNSTGAMIVEYSVMDTSALTASTAGWSSTTYGAANYDKYKIALTTANSIKEDSEITIKLFSTRNVAATEDFYFVDPDPTVEV